MFKNISLIQLEGELFECIQFEKIFVDSKTFVDLDPIADPKEILKEFSSLKDNRDFDLNNFIEKYFTSPNTKTPSDPQTSIQEYIKNRFVELERHTPHRSHHSSLVPLPYKYISLSDRFRESHYSETFFSLLGLKHFAKKELILSICHNLCYQINKFGFIPQGNRVYYLSRSNPPFFASIISLIENLIDQNELKYFVDALEKEYFFWMSGAEYLNNENTQFRRVIFSDGKYFNRYFDDNDGPRVEVYKEDIEFAKSLNQGNDFKNIRATSESGWTCSRWMNDSKLDILNIAPIDLHCLMFNIEERLSHWFMLLGDEVKRDFFEKKSEERKNLIKYFWNEEKGYFFDYNLKEKKQSDSYTLAGVFPLYFKLASQDQAESVAKTLEEKFLFEGGLVSKLNLTDPQISPNGEASLHYMTYHGLKNYGFNDLAEKIKIRWIDTCEIKYIETHKTFEKYDVVSVEKIALNEDYELQEGYGPTNGVYMDFII